MTEEEQKRIFDTWLGKYRPLLFKVVRAYAFNLADQEDLFQDISLQVWRSIPNFRKESQVSTWLYRVSLNTALRRNRTESKYLDNQYPFEHVEHLLEEPEEPVDERLAWLYGEIAKLNEVDRSLTLLLLDGLSYKEMAEVIGISESNIGVKIHRIKKYLTTQSQKFEQHGV